MISKYLDTGIAAILLLILLVSPTQYSFQLGSAHVSIADPLIWLGGLLFCVSAAFRVLFAKDTGAPLSKRLFSFFREILPLPENILFVVLIALSVVKAQNRTESLKELFQVVEYVIVVFVLFSKIRISAKMMARLPALLLFIVSIVVLTALFQYFNGSVDIMGVKGTFGNRNTYGGFLAVALPLVLSTVILDGRWLMKAWGLLILVAAAITVLSGGAAIGLLAGCSLVCISVSRRSFIIWALTVAIAGAFILPRLPRDNVETLVQSISMFDEDGKAQPRYTEWQASVQMWHEKPLLGIGLGNYQSQIGMNYGFLPVKEGPKEHDHNNLFLVFASSTGLVGLLGLLAIFPLWLQRTASAYLAVKPDGCSAGNCQRILALGAAGAVAAFCITSIWTALLVRGVFLIFVIIVALAVNSNSRRTEIQ